MMTCYVCMYYDVSWLWLASLFLRFFTIFRMLFDNTDEYVQVALLVGWLLLLLQLADCEL